MTRMVLISSILLIGMTVHAQSREGNCEPSRIDAIKVFECGRGLTSPFVVVAKVVRISDGKIVANLMVAEFSESLACQEAAIRANAQK